MEDNQARETTDLNSENLILFFYKWRKPLFVIATLAIVISSVVSLFIQDKYQSKVVLFPTTTSSISKALLSEHNTNKEDILKFGEDEEVEQMLQILHSDEIRNKIIEKYDLANHYGIDKNAKFRKTKLQKEYESNVNFSKTKFMSVEISVLDYSADTASFIANDISAYIDTVKNRMRREIAVQAFLIVEKRYNDQKKYINNLEDSLTVLRKLGVIDYESQAERITEQMAIAILQGKTKAIKLLEEKLTVLSEYGGAYVSIRDELEFEKKQLTNIHAKYEEVKVDAENNLQHKFVVNRAFSAEKKTYPIRWLIVFFSTIATVLIAMFIILVKEKLNLK